MYNSVFFLFFFFHWKNHEKATGKENMSSKKLPSDIDYKLKQLWLKV